MALLAEAALQARLGRHALREHALVPPPRQLENPLSAIGRWSPPRQSASDGHAKHSVPGVADGVKKPGLHSHCSIPVLACSTAFVLFGHEKQRAAPERLVLRGGARLARRHQPALRKRAHLARHAVRLPGLRLEAARRHVVQYGAPVAFE